MSYRRQCSTCGAYLGGGVCEDKLELECAEGNFEAWRPCVSFPGIDAAEAYVHAIDHRGGFRIRREQEKYVLTLDGLEDDKNE